MTYIPAGFSADYALNATTDRLCETLIVVPCYNEEKRLNDAAFINHLDTHPTTGFLFVDDGSKDATLERLKDLQSRRPDRISVLTLSQNSGKAEAVRQGLIFASKTSARFVGYWDADLATPLDMIEDFSRVARKFDNLNVVFGSRRPLLGHRINRTLPRRIVSRACAMLARQAVRLPIGDTQCGAKLMRNSAALRQAVDAPFTAGWLFDVELFARLSQNLGYANDAFYEFPLPEWEEVAGSKVSGSAIVKAGFRMLRLIAEIRLGVPPVAAKIAPPVAHRVHAQPALALVG